MTNYKSISSEYLSELIIKKSKFIAISKNVESLEQIDEFLLELEQKYAQATHICYAYELRTGEQKAVDAKEPSGTAGLPILNVIKKQNLKNTIIAVIRYFGGVKLGAGGLIRAYGKVASESVKNAKIVNYEAKNAYQIILSYDDSKLLTKLENTDFIEVTNKQFKEQVLVDLQIDANNYLKLTKTLNNLFNKEVNIKELGTVYKGE